MGKYTSSASERCLDTWHPSTDESGRFAIDQLLRRHGWSIHARPRAGDTLWCRPLSSGYEIQPEALILEGLDDTEVADAVYTEELYLDRKIGLGRPRRD